MRCNALLTMAVVSAALAVPPTPLTCEDAAASSDVEFRATIDKLNSMLTSRDLDLYELDFEPLVTHRIVARNRLGREQAFDCLIYRIRNRVLDSTESVATRAKGYNEVLSSITAQFASAKVDTSEGVRLVVDGVESKERVILQRQESKLRTRTVRLGALAYNENGTRLRILGQISEEANQENHRRALAAAAAGGALQEKPVKYVPLASGFSDLGEPDRDFVLDDVRRLAEEKFGKRLLSTDELTKRPLPPFDGVSRVQVADIEAPEYAMNGWYVGEAYGVLCFAALSPYGRNITLELTGLSNKMRRDSKQPEPIAGKVDDYFTRRWLRRSYVMTFYRPGDEFYRDQDPLTVQKGTWMWRPAFVRVQARQDIAYANYVMSNIRLIDKQDSPDQQIATQFWTIYDSNRARFPAQAAADPAGTAPSLPDFQSLLKAKAAP